MIVLAPLGRAGVRLIHRILYRYYGLFVYSDAADCLYLTARAACPRDITLSDGAVVKAGDPLLVLHFWNERLEERMRRNPNVGSLLATATRPALVHLARFLETHPAYADVRAIHAVVGFLPDVSLPRFARYIERYGFDVILGERPGWNARRWAFWQNLFSWWMMWAFNPRSLEGKSFGAMQRLELWMSREELLRRYGGRAEPTPRL